MSIPNSFAFNIEDILTLQAMSPELDIRAKVEDLYVLDEFPEFAEDPSAENVVNSPRNLIRNIISTVVTLVAVDLPSKSLLGFVMLDKGRTRTKDEAMLHYLLVAENARGSGIGSILVDEAERKAKSMGYNSMYLLSTLNIDIFPRHSFYTNLGYTPIAHEASLDERSCSMIKKL